MRILAVVPARGGSKGIPRKNITLVAGRPLIAYTLAAAQTAQCLDRVVVSTDDAEIAAVSHALGAEVLMRPAELADDHATTRAVLLHVVEALAATGYRPDAVMTLQPTSPLRTATHVDEAAGLFMADPQADSLVSCLSVPHIFHPTSVMRQTPDGYLEPFFLGTQPTRRQDKEPVFARNGAAIYITRTIRLHEYIFGGRLLPYMMAPSDSIDIDQSEDLLAAERLLLERG
jgi:CMP-N,N'-diacetyllegionaminic acid synthase